MGLQRLRARLAALEQRFPVPRSSVADVERLKRLGQVDERLIFLLDEADKLLGEEGRTVVQEALRQWQEERAGPYRMWFADLGDGFCRLPQLPAAAMKELLLAWLSPQCDGGLVCWHCGLEYPRHRTPPLNAWKVLPGRVPLQGSPPWYDLPEFFRACPGCGTSTYEIDWPMTLAGHRPWMDMDGCVTEC
jgi:hypothetical protein